MWWGAVAVRSCAGYPSRKTVEEFVDRFGLLDTAAWLDEDKPERDVVLAILAAAKLEGWQIGLTKVTPPAPRTGPGTP